VDHCIDYDGSCQCLCCASGFWLDSINNFCKACTICPDLYESICTATADAVCQAELPCQILHCLAYDAQLKCTQCESGWLLSDDKSDCLISSPPAPVPSSTGQILGIPASSSSGMDIIIPGVSTATNNNGDNGGNNNTNSNTNGTPGQPQQTVRDTCNVAACSQYTIDGNGQCQCSLCANDYWLSGNVCHACTSCLGGATTACSATHDSICGELIGFVRSGAAARSSTTVVGSVVIIAAIAAALLHN